MTRKAIVTMSLTDEDIDLLYSAMFNLRGDVSASGDDDPEGAENLVERLLNARGRIRAKIRAAA